MNTGKIASKSGNRVSITANAGMVRRLKKGTSVSVDGICLTAISRTKYSFDVDVIPETFKRTALKDRVLGDETNLELPVSSRDLLSGHIVQGHVDGVGTIQKIHKEENAYTVTIKVSPDIARYIVEKGSVAIDGIALTVVSAAACRFTVGIIPHTWRITNLHHRSVGDAVNIETDIIAKYVAKAASIYEK